VVRKNSIQLFSRQRSNVTFWSRSWCNLSFVFLNLADSKGIHVGKYSGEGQV
jgi:hypothetical protein